jgi:hypothetical protein
VATPSTAARGWSIVPTAHAVLGLGTRSGTHNRRILGQPRISWRRQRPCEADASIEASVAPLRRHRFEAQRTAFEHGLQPVDATIALSQGDADEFHPPAERYDDLPILKLDCPRSPEARNAETGQLVEENSALRVDSAFRHG